MAKLADLLTDEKAINEGAWITVNEAVYGDLKIRTRGFNDEFVDAQAARLRRARLAENLDDAAPLPNAMQREVNASLLRDHLVLDVANLEGPDGQPVTIEAFHAMLGQANATRLARACWDAASKVTARTAKANQDVQGN